MSVLLITLLVFLGSFGVLVSSLYFLIEVPEARRKLRARMTALEEASAAGYVDPQVDFAAREIAARVPPFLRWMLSVPGISAGQRYVEQAGLQTLIWVPVFTTLLLAVAGYIVGVLVQLPWLGSIVVAALAGSLPFAVIAWKRQKRFRRFEQVFPEAMDMLARAVRAGYAATSAFSLIADEMPDPVAGEFRILYEQQNLGLPLWKALDNFANRVPLADVQIFATTMRIQQETGGNLAEVLDKLSYVIRERFRLLRQVQVFTAEGRLSMTILMALPPAMAFLLYLVNRDYILSLFTDPLGLRMLAFALGMQAIGFLVIRKIIRIRV